MRIFDLIPFRAAEPEHDPRPEHVRRRKAPSYVRRQLVRLTKEPQTKKSQAIIADLRAWANGEKDAR